ncbi:MAG: hypothetical protein MHPSP_001129, partial [Paramarteilia canceri]
NLLNNFIKEVNNHFLDSLTILTDGAKVFQQIFNRQIMVDNIYLDKESKISVDMSKNKISYLKNPGKTIRINPSDPISEVYIMDLKESSLSKMKIQWNNLPKKTLTIKNQQQHLGNFVGYKIAEVSNGTNSKITKSKSFKIRVKENFDEETKLALPSIDYKNDISLIILKIIKILISISFILFLLIFICKIKVINFFIQPVSEIESQKKMICSSK